MPAEQIDFDVVEFCEPGGIAGPVIHRRFAPRVANEAGAWGAILTPKIALKLSNRSLPLVRDIDDHVARFAGSDAADDGHAMLDNARFFRRDLRQRIA